MSTTEVHNAGHETAAAKVGMHLEIVIIPVSDVDRAKQFYQRLGSRLDADDAPLEGLRIVQFTPPGSGASVTSGTGLTTAVPGSAEGGLIVSDIQTARDALAGRGIDASEIWPGPLFPAEARQPGPDPERTSYGSFFSFTDPDANTWLVQEVEDWPAWYAAYMVAEQAGTDLPALPIPRLPRRHRHGGRGEAATANGSKPTV